jgi:hypothetical protein
VSANREETLFGLALEKPVAERAAFLEGDCLGDPALRTRVEALLAASAKVRLSPRRIDQPSPPTLLDESS